MNQYRAVATIGTAFVILCLTAGPRQVRASVPAQREVSVNADRNGQTVNLAPGDHLTVSLPGNPTTGYLWEVSGGLDAAVLKQLGEPGFQKETGLIGAAGVQVFQFAAVGPGGVELALGYHRPWEKDSPPAKTFTVRVAVQPAQMPREITLTDQDNGATVDMATGETLVVALEGNPTTGFVWEPGAAFDTAVLTRLGESTFQPQSGAMGAPGQEMFKFSAAGPGQVTLTLVHHRPWEKDVAPDKTFSATVIVEGAEPSLTLSAKDNGHHVDLRPGQRIMLVLDANPTTGYLWQVDDVEAGVLNQIGEPGFHQDSGLSGAGGTESYLFEAVGAGETLLNLSYRRPWETRVAPASTFSMTVTVK